MTKKQIQAVEYNAKIKTNKFFKDNGDIKAIFHNALIAGMAEVINNPEKYGLSTKKDLQNK